MSAVWDRIKFRDLTGKDKELGEGLLTMFCEYGPFQTFGTITVEPRHDRCGASAAQMEKIIHRLFRKRRFKGMKYNFFIEDNKLRIGTHGHFCTANEPKDLRWTKVWEYVHERYGRFQTTGVNGAKTFGLAAYLAKYCSKELSDSHWGFVGWGETEKEKRPKLRPKWDKDPAPIQDPEDVQALRENAAAWKWQKDAGSKIRQHAGDRENGRLNIKTSYDSKAEVFTQEEVYNNWK